MLHHELGAHVVNVWQKFIVCSHFAGWGVLSGSNWRSNRDALTLLAAFGLGWPLLDHSELDAPLHAVDAIDEHADADRPSNRSCGLRWPMICRVFS